MTTHDAIDCSGARIVPPRRRTIAAMIPPAAMKRVATASSGGSVSTATAIARYVEPQMM
jgi:hypothetical protein